METTQKLDHQSVISALQVNKGMVMDYLALTATKTNIVVRLVLCIAKTVLSVLLVQKVVLRKTIVLFVLVLLFLVSV